MTAAKEWAALPEPDRRNVLTLLKTVATERDRMAREYGGHWDAHHAKSIRAAIAVLEEAGREGDENG